MVNEILTEHELSYHAWAIAQKFNEVELSINKLANTELKYPEDQAAVIEIQISDELSRLLGMAEIGLWLESSTLTYREYRYLHRRYIAIKNQARFYINSYIPRRVANQLGE